MLAVILISVGVITLGGAGSPVGAYIASFLGLLVFTLCTIGCFAALRESSGMSKVVSVQNRIFNLAGFQPTLDSIILNWNFPANVHILQTFLFSLLELVY